QVARLQAENQLRVAGTNLRNTLGLPTGPPLRLVEPSPSEAIQPAPLPDLEAEAMRIRPEVVSDEANLRAANLAVDLTRLQRRALPVGTIGVNITPRSETARSNFNFNTAVTMPVFDAGVSVANERIARSAARSAAATLDQTKKDVTAEVEV